MALTPQRTSSSHDRPTVHRATAEARARAHWRVAVTILAVNGGLYAGLILLIAFNKPLLARLISPGLSLAIVFGTIVTVAAWLLTLVYVRWANAHDHDARRS